MFWHKPGSEKPRLVASSEEPWNNKVFYVESGKRHWVQTVEHLEGYGFTLADTVGVSGKEIRNYEPAGPLPRRIPPEYRVAAPAGADPWLLREIATSTLTGQGIEFGAGTSPVAVPIHCKVKFADFLPEQQIRDRIYEGQGSDFVPLSYVASVEDPSNIENGSQDFIIAAHVIEHVRNPILAMRKLHDKLKPGGQLILFVPDMQGTFDKNRTLTSLMHFVEDFQQPDSERDAANFQEFTRCVYGKELSLEEAHRAMTNGDDCHFHTFTHESFVDLVAWCRENVTPWSSVWSHARAAGSFEFYFALTK